MSSSDSAGLYDVLAWLEINKNKVIGAAAAAVVVGFCVYAYIWKADQRNIAANDALAQVQLESSASERTNHAEEASNYLAVARKFDGTAPGERALVLAARDFFDAGQYAEAQQRFESFLKSRPDSLMSPIAAYGAASALEAQNKLDAALAAYQEVTVRYASSAVADQARLGMARIYKAKHQPDLALKIYNGLERPADSTLMFQVNALKKQLLAQHPELEAKESAANAAPSKAAAGTNLLRLPSTAAPGASGAVRVIPGAASPAPKGVKP